MLSACDPEQREIIDSRPIPLSRAPLGPGDPPGGGALMALARDPGATDSYPVVIDTAFVIPAFAAGRCPDGAARLGRHSFDLLGTLPAGAPVRARFAHVQSLFTCLGPVGDPGTVPLGLVGGSLLSDFSVELVLPRGAGTTPTMTLWRRLPAPSDFLASIGYAVLDFQALGGGDVRLEGNPDRVTPVPATRVVLRACAVPDAFDPGAAIAACPRGQENTVATGENLSLLLGTGHGPLILGESAWTRLARRLGVPSEAGEARPLLAAQVSAPIAARWTTIPRLALVDRELSAEKNPGACAELARSRRLEWVERHHGQPGACFQPCDADGDRAKNAAAYIELGGDIPVAIVDDASEILVGLRGDIAPFGQQIDGIVGAGVLTPTRLEIDYRGDPDRRVIASCVGEPDRAVCWTSPRCPRVPRSGQTHRCFGLPSQGFTRVCSG